jgi:hypothetical protein
VVREGDRFQALFTVRNGGDKGMRVEIRPEASGIKNLPARTLDLSRRREQRKSPGRSPCRKARRRGLDPGRAGSRRQAARRPEGEANRAARDSATGAIRQPATAGQGAGHPRGRPRRRHLAELRATLAASLLDGQTTLRDTMRRYPFACLEQQASKAVATRDAKLWQGMADHLPTYLADNGLANFFPGNGGGNVALTAYLLSLADEAAWTLPADARARMERALAEYLEGRLDLARPAWEQALPPRMAALEALARAGKATPELISTVKPEPRLWPTSVLIDWIGVIKHTARLPQRDSLLREALEALETTLHQHGQTPEPEQRRAGRPLVDDDLRRHQRGAGPAGRHGPAGLEGADAQAGHRRPGPPAG